jgi:hypothetical protein
VFGFEEHKRKTAACGARGRRKLCQQENEHPTEGSSENSKLKEKQRDYTS